MKLILCFISLLLCCAALNGCNTFEGLGKDIQSGGNAITNAATDSSSSPKKTTTVHSVNPATVTAPSS